MTDLVTEAVREASNGNIYCRASSYGNGCAGADLDVEFFLVDLRASGWDVVRTDDAEHFRTERDKLLALINAQNDMALSGAAIAALVSVR